MYVISIINRKGGVGKTTATINLANEIARLDKMVLLIDLDSQIDLTNFFVKDDYILGMLDTIQGVLEGNCKAIDTIVEVEGKENLYIIPGSKDIDQTFRLKYSQKALYDSLEVDELSDIDIVLIDCPSNLNEAVETGLYASDYAVLVTETESLSIENLKKTITTIEEVDKQSPKDLKVAGILVNKVDMRRNITKDNLKLLRDLYNKELLESTISVDSSIVYSHKLKKPVRDMEYRPRSVSQFQRAAEEILLRVEQDEAKDNNKDCESVSTTDTEVVAHGC